MIIPLIIAVLVTLMKRSLGNTQAFRTSRTINLPLRQKPVMFIWLSTVPTISVHPWYNEFLMVLIRPENLHSNISDVATAKQCQETVISVKHSADHRLHSSNRAKKNFIPLIVINPTYTEFYRFLPTLATDIDTILIFRYCFKTKMNAS